MRRFAVLGTLAPYPYEQRNFSASTSFSTKNKNTYFILSLIKNIVNNLLLSSQEPSLFYHHHHYDYYHDATTIITIIIIIIIMMLSCHDHQITTVI